MRKIGLAGLVVVVMLAAVPRVQAEFALGDQDRVAFFGNKVLTRPDMPMAVETFLRIRYPELKARFRTYGKHEAAILKGAVERFDKLVATTKPTVVVLCFGTDDIPQHELNESHFKRFQGDFAALVEHVKKSAAHVYVMTPLFPEVSKKDQLRKIQYDQTMSKYAEAMRTVANEKGAKLIDWFAASEAYCKAHSGNRRLAITKDGVKPSTLGYNIGSTEILDAFGADPLKVKITANWTGKLASASMGKAVVTKVGEDKIKLELTGVPIPWVVPDRGIITGADWPGSKYQSFVLQIPDAPKGGIIVSEPNDKNALPYLSQQLLEGADMSFVGPLTKRSEVTGLATWIKAKCQAVRRHQDFMRKPIPEPEYKQSYETYYLGLEQYADATDRIVARQPRTMTVTLELYKVPLPPGGAVDKDKGKGTRMEPRHPKGKLSPRSKHSRKSIQPRKLPAKEKPTE
ncbi:MAG: hypothetical protein KAV82_01260 [Phycisphaerae bacterium]|nr:hypothetical protein [Phycisphaerae bacterium]